MIPLRLPAPSTAPNEAHENEQRNKRASSFSDVKIFYRRELLKQPFLPELRAVINASYRDHDINPIGKIGYRLQTDTQIADEIDSSGFTAVATVSNEIVGTASVKPWVSKAEGVAWKPRGYYEGKNANEVLSMHSPCLDIHNSDADSDSCEGDFEILLVAVKPGVQYRKRGIAEGLFILGILISAIVLALGYNTGGCFNGARDFGPRLVALMAGWGGQVFKEKHAWWIWGPWAADITGGLCGTFTYDLAIFTGAESPINYPRRRRKRALLIKQKNLMHKLRFGRRKIRDVETAVREVEQ
ncbi:hypothetical protein CNMCM5878_006795 [Aspergillus fumigatiaffinis]|nr:hypothetical protein CNMCM5878_006795 [Aspergillus fumigatiaffinis]